MYFGESQAREHRRYRQAQDEGVQGGRETGRESLLDLQSLIDRLFIDLV